MTYSLPEITTRELLSRERLQELNTSRSEYYHLELPRMTATESMERSVLHPSSTRYGSHLRELEEIIYLISRELRQDNSPTQNWRWLERSPRYNSESVVQGLREWADFHRVELRLESTEDYFRIDFRPNQRPHINEAPRTIDTPKVSEIEQKLGVSSDIWDTLSAQEIISAVVDVIQQKEQRNEQRNQASSRFHSF